jgi:hypothetical protein
LIRESMIGFSQSNVWNVTRAHASLGDEPLVLKEERAEENTSQYPKLYGDIRISKSSESYTCPDTLKPSAALPEHFACNTYGKIKHLKHACWTNCNHTEKDPKPPPVIRVNTADRVSPD